MGGPSSPTSNSRSTRRKSRMMSEINVTPFVDVMLVLLIIFMVTAPMMTVGIPVDLPKAAASAISDDTEPLTISVNEAGEIYIQETKVDAETLVPKLQAITGEKPDTRIFVRGDKDVSYGTIMKVMGTVTSSGFTKVSLLAEMPESASKPKKK